MNYDFTENSEYDFENRMVAPEYTPEDASCGLGNWSERLQLDTCRRKRNLILEIQLRMQWYGMLKRRRWHCWPYLQWIGRTILWIRYAPYVGHVDP